MTQPQVSKEEVFDYLDDLHAQGVTAYYSLFVESAFGVTRAVADELVQEWLEGHPEWRPYSEDIT